MFKELLAGWLMSVAEAFASHKGVSTTAAINQVTGDAQLFYRLNGGAGFKVITYDRWMQQFSDAWPPDCAWPEGVRRPAALAPVAASSSPPLATAAE